ncbi:winged helix DNA-binding domain-containing protein [Nocardioides sp. NBC_00850]|uniref:winged helix DNA-binding domain-containing protein n=1 Tax=Nocardioides sp. NBC_00850 TaxID=2976001 RepID=UPI0038691563|nr:winged helix DNA-binding domain-containing protein [Nocardioides sp. NBC_00850]
MAERIERENVVAFRLASHHLDVRVGERDLLTAAGQCGIQNTPPGSALLAFHARVEGVSAAGVAGVVEDRSMLLTWSMRGAPYYVPTAEAEVYTTGVLPETEEARRHFVLGVEQAVDRLGLNLTEMVEMVTAATCDVLPGRQLAIDELGAEVAVRIALELTAQQRRVWIEEGPYAAGQPIGEAVVHFCVRLLALQRTVCFAPRTGNRAPFVLTEEWLGRPVAEADPVACRRELLRRYLRCYGPSTRSDFATWLGVRAGDVDPWWSNLEDELVEVDFGGRAWALAGDLDALRTATMPTGVRLLPPRDAYTQLRDRETIVDKAHHRDIWRTVGDPGTMLADGEIVGTWRARKSGRKLRVELEAFEALSRRHREALVSEAESIAPLRDTSSVSLDVTTD